MESGRNEKGGTPGREVRIEQGNAFGKWERGGGEEA
jgi:hypothetical protein